MKKIVLIGFGLCLAFVVNAQNKDKAKIDIQEKGKGFYYETILKDVNAVNEIQKKAEPYKRFVMDQSGKDLPNKVDLYTQKWAQKWNRKEMPGAAGVFLPYRFTKRKYYVSK